MSERHKKSFGIVMFVTVIISTETYFMAEANGIDSLNIDRIGFVSIFILSA